MKELPAQSDLWIFSLLLKYCRERDDCCANSIWRFGLY